MEVNENEEYLCAVQSSLGKHKLLYAPEVDAADKHCYNPDHEDLQCFVEFKTSKEPENDRINRSLHK